MRKCPNCGHILETKEKDPDGFEEWWNVSTRKKAKGAARRAYSTALKKTTKEVLLSAYRLYGESRKGEPEQYTLHPATWLNGECWHEMLGKIAAASSEAVPIAVPTTWQNHADKLIARIGTPRFVTWFGESELELEPFPVLYVKRPFLRDWIAKNFGNELRSLFGRIEIVVRKDQ